MAALDRQLVHRGDRLAPLFTPPFDKTALDPGYIKGYPPGIRENGGQYTHAAAWSIMGFAALGQGDKAAELFSLINPINHTATRAGVLRYKVEPYVVGGRRLFGGAACRARRLDLVHGLGRLALPRRRRGHPRPAPSRATSLLIDPCIPTAWPGFEMTLRYRGAVYEISVRNSGGVSRGVVAAEIDGEPQQVAEGKTRIRLREDNCSHAIRVTLG